MPEYKLQNGDTILDVLINASLVPSKNEGRRMLQQNGVRLDGELLTDGQALVPHPGIIQVGKRKFVRIQD
jgi:tyrosyl-tRNA synthetase